MERFVAQLAFAGASQIEVSPKVSQTATIRSQGYHNKPILQGMLA
jgi:hypothetical protein